MAESYPDRLDSVWGGEFELKMQFVNRRGGLAEKLDCLLVDSASRHKVASRG